MCIRAQLVRGSGAGRGDVASGRLALKGESSAHFQHVKEFWTDCDKDVVLFKVDQDVAACHEGYRSCFYRKHEGGQWKVIGEKAFDPDKVYHK